MYESWIWKKILSIPKSFWVSLHPFSLKDAIIERHNQRHSVSSLAPTAAEALPICRPRGRSRSAHPLSPHWRAILHRAASHKRQGYQWKRHFFMRQRARPMGCVVRDILGRRRIWTISRVLMCATVAHRHGRPTKWVGYLSLCPCRDSSVTV